MHSEPVPVRALLAVMLGLGASGEPRPEAPLGFDAPSEPRPWTPGARFPEQVVRLPLPFAARPTTLPEDQFGVRFSVGASRIGSTLEGALEAGAGYGLTDAVEVGLALLRLTLVEAGSPGGGLAAPVVYGRIRTVLGPLELGAEADLSLPFDGLDAANIALLGRLHLGERARLDLLGRIGGRFDEGPRWPFEVPAELVVSVADRLAIGVGARIDGPDVAGEVLALRPEARVVLTVGGPQGAPWGDLILAARAPPIRLRGDAPDAWSGTIDLVLFFDDEDESPW